MMTIIELNNKTITELELMFNEHKKVKGYNCSFKSHIIYEEFGLISLRMNINYPSKEMQEKVLLETIEGFEKYIDYKIESLGLANGDEKDNRKYYLKGKFKDEKQFYIFALTH